MDITINDVLKIKRYPNRKLYNTQTAKYINITDIASYIKQGRAVQVVDAKGTDITPFVIQNLVHAISRNIPQQELLKLVVEYGA